MGIWLRLTKSEESLTVHASDEKSLRLTRSVAKALFSRVADGDGNAFHKYLNKDGAPILEFRHTGSNWEVRVPEESHNTMLLDGVEVGAPWRKLESGSRLQLFSRKQGRGLAEIEFSVEMEG